MIYLVLLLALACTAVGIILIRDVRGLASRLRAQEDTRHEWDPIYRAFSRRVPRWPTAFGVWWILCGIGFLVYFHGLTYGMWS